MGGLHGCARCSWNSGFATKYSSRTTCYMTRKIFVLMLAQLEKQTATTKCSSLVCSSCLTCFTCCSFILSMGMAVPFAAVKTIFVM